MVKIGLEEEEEHQTTSSTTKIAPPHPLRRPRVREVSSRFMSPIVSSSSSGDLHLPASKHSDLLEVGQQPPLCSAYENRLEMLRSPVPVGVGSQTKSLLLPPTTTATTQKKQRAVKLFYKENHNHNHNRGGGGKFFSGIGIVRNGSNTTLRPRPDTPMTMATVSMIPKYQPSTNTVAKASSTAAAKLVQLSGMTASTDGSSQFEVSENLLENLKSTESSEIEKLTIINSNGGEEEGKGEVIICDSPLKSNCKMRTLPDFRSSMPEVDLSSRLLQAPAPHRGKALLGGEYSKVTTSPCHRSLTEHSFSNSSSTKSINKSTSALSKHHHHHPSTTFKSLPPQPSNTKSGGTEAARKGRKISCHQEDVHALRLLQNRYLQWRYANAKAEVAMNSQLITAQVSFHALVAKISELSDSVKRKRTELGLLRRTGTLSTIIESQMPYLDQWSSLEGDYSSSLSGAIKALQDVSIRLPIIGNVRADVREVGGALNSASNVMEIMSSHVEYFLPKAGEMDTLISELAGVVSRERALIEECGDLLTKTRMLQVEECSLRGQLIQLK